MSHILTAAGWDLLNPKFAGHFRTLYIYISILYIYISISYMYILFLYMYILLFVYLHNYVPHSLMHIYYN